MKSSVLFVFCNIFITFFLASCEGGKSKPSAGCGAGEREERGRCVAGDLTVELVSESACYEPSDGTTTLVLQYIARDEAGVAIVPDSPGSTQAGPYSVTLRVNGDALDAESLIDTNSQLLRSDLAMSLVLDSSYSMTQYTPPAFEPMKQAAIDVLATTANEWEDNQSDFFWDLVWFNSKVSHAIDNNAGEPWEISDIQAIPTPEQSDFTALLKAVDYALGLHRQWFDDGVATGENDRHVMIVFSDGKDNYSFFDDPNENVENNLDNMLFWETLSLPSVNGVSEIRTPDQLPNLSVYVLGMGESVDEEELAAIAELGNGQFFYVSDSDSLTELFAQVERELIRLQTLGIRTPLPAGDYEFELSTTRIADGAETSYTWTRAAGASLPECEEG